MFLRRCLTCQQAPSCSLETKPWQAVRTLVETFNQDGSVECRGRGVVRGIPRPSPTQHVLRSFPESFPRWPQCLQCSTTLLKQVTRVQASPSILISRRLHLSNPPRTTKPRSTYSHQRRIPQSASINKIAVPTSSYFPTVVVAGMLERASDGLIFCISEECPDAPTGSSPDFGRTLYNTRTRVRR